jgi:23S rRNA (adenine2503-C2)-methyltransferase
MIKDFNDEIVDADKLVEFLKGIPSKINLIPYNKTENNSFVTTIEDRIEEFREYLLKKNIHTLIRKSRGIDIGGACGQLGD